jgi:hypothetical protein
MTCAAHCPCSQSLYLLGVLWRKVLKAYVLVAEREFGRDLRGHARQRVYAKMKDSSVAEVMAIAFAERKERSRCLQGVERVMGAGCLATGPRVLQADRVTDMLKDKLCRQS